ncbi:hypothetical protein SSX86_015684 [Deinandra increscens subsp. villosa]|uniref:non-specific serine/threonine protein kinase n=1 Tax=Deinandra increscens subsp. villosa TaxID=3103831 RepID=A0AAP0GXD7_9ASTR
MAATKAEFLLFLTLNFVILLRFSESVVPQQEVEAVGNFLAAMNATSWRINGNTCNLDVVTEVPRISQEANASIACDCNIGNDTDCHVVRITHKFYSLDGVLSPELAKLPYIKSLDLAYNLLTGTIPPEWGLTRLLDISLLGNRISGEIPRELGNISTLTKLDLEANQLSGTVPPDLGKLTNLVSLILSSNRLTGRLPTTLGQLGNLTNFRINENNFSGSIPDFIQNWRQITRLEIVASGLTGPIPSNISLLENLLDLRISDIGGPAQGFPELNNASGLIRLILRNCNISGEVPDYIWQVRDLEMLDVSFNQLVGRISDNILGRSLRLVFLTSNMLSGGIPDALLVNGASIDLSYNNLTWQGPNQPTCRQNTNFYVNLFRSSSTGNPIQDVLPCTNNVKCPRYACSLHVNCGGNDVTIRESNGRSVLYEGDANVDGGAARLYRAARNWGFSSTGDFMDDNIFQNTRYIESLQGNTSLPALYTTARLSPLTLAYFSYCLENGEYSVKLHFAEIQFSNDSTYISLGRRVFDIYIQGRLVRKDFDIENEAGGVGRPVVVPFNASVTDNILEIRFYWAGKGTTRFPKRGVYGPLVSAIDADPYFKTCSTGGKKSNKGVYIGVGIGVPLLVFFILVVLWRKKCFKGRKTGKDYEGTELKTLSFSLKQLKIATNNFNASNKIGEGGFGAVFKGTLTDGTVVAVKQLSSQSKQGNREFLNEIGVISCLQHPNLVKLHGCCIEGDQLLLVYEYLENNSLANALFGECKSILMLDWPTRFEICIGVARGLAFLHDESRLKIVHRDIKATNVLLDKDFNPKISDFGLAKLNEDDKTHVSTRVAGTIGYMAPEYALWGYLSDKADVYSYGVVLLEIVSGKNNTSYIPTNECICLLDWACRLETSKQYEELIDENLESTINKEEAATVVKVALLCTNVSPSMRPTMSEVVNMLEGKTCVPEIAPEASGNEDLRFKAMRDFQTRGESLKNPNYHGLFHCNSYIYIFLISYLQLLIYIFPIFMINLPLIYYQEKDVFIEGKVDWKGRAATKHKHGGMRAAVLILATFAFENMANVVLAVNFVSYFTKVMHYDIADAANHVTNFMGTGYIISIVMACLADAYMGRLRVLLIAVFVECVGLSLLTIQAHYPKLKPPVCNIFLPTSNCETLSGKNAVLLFFAIYSLAIGNAGVKAALPSHGADQFDEKDPKEATQMSSFFNWLLLALAVGGSFSLTFFVWVQDNKGFDYGFGLSLIAMFLGAIICLVGLPWYRIYVVLGSSAIIQIIQVYVVAIKNRKLQLPEDPSELHEISMNKEAALHHEFLPHRDVYRWLDKAAIRSDNTDESPWKLCSVTQVENAKILLAMVPVFGCSFIMTLCLAQLQTFSVQQGVTMDIKLTNSFNIPPASLPIIPVLFLLFLIPVYDQIFVPLMRKFTGIPTGITYLQRVGVGLVLSAISMTIAGIMEVKRKNVAKHHNMLDAIPLLQPLPISVFWLSIQYFVFGIADMFTYVGLLEFFYSQAPKSIKSISSCFLWTSMAVGYFMSSITVNLVNDATKGSTKSKGWLAGNNINRNHLENFYWLLAILSMINFIIYVFVASKYKYRPQNLDVEDEYDETQAQMKIMNP